MLVVVEEVVFAAGHILYSLCAGMDSPFVVVFQDVFELVAVVCTAVDHLYAFRPSAVANAPSRRGGLGFVLHVFLSYKYVLFWAPTSVFLEHTFFLDGYLLFTFDTVPNLEVRVIY